MFELAEQLCPFKRNLHSEVKYENIVNVCCVYITDLQCKKCQMFFSVKVMYMEPNEVCNKNL
jgi:hypothetical protein